MSLLKRTVFLILVLALAPSQAWGKVYLDIDTPTFQQFAVAIPDFQISSEKEQAKEINGAAISDALSNYLKMTGFFNALNKKAYPDDQKRLPEGPAGVDYFSDWRIIGTEYLVKGSLQDQGNDLVVMEFRLYDVVKAEFILGKKYKGKRIDIALMTRTFAGEILLALTGEGGIFSTRIAFIMKKGNNSDLFSVNFDGSGLVREREGKNILMSPRWSPDGRYLSFTSFEDGNPDFFVKDMVHSTVAKISSYKGINLSGGWSPSGRKVLLTLSKDGNEEIYVLDFANSLVQRLTSSFAIDVSPVWSPDGGKIAFVSNRSGSPQIYIMGADGSNVRRLTFEGNYNTSPAWSPKGDRIAYEGRVDGRFQIFTIGVEGENVKQLTFGDHDNYSPTWSPDGRYIAFNQSRKTICVMNANGSNVRKLFEGKGDSVLPYWSPQFKLG